MENCQTTALSKGKETVLVIDDDDMVADICRQILETSGYDVVSAKSGEEAIAIFKENQDSIDMVILDMIMPDMGGRDVCDRLKEINSGIKVLLASGYDLDSQASEIMERGCNGFIQKPYNMNILLEKTREILTSK